MGGDQLVAHWRIQQVADLRSCINLIDHLEGLEGEDSQLAIGSARSSCNSRLLGVETDSLDCRLMLIPYDKWTHLLHREYIEFVVVASSCNQFRRRTQLEPTNLLVVSFIPHDLSPLPQILDGNKSISTSRAYQILRTA